jgi:hypothetical protein
MWMARVLLRNRPVTPHHQIHTRQQWKMCLSGGMLLHAAGQQRINEALARNHITSSLCGLPFATIELRFLCMVRAEAIKRE